MAVTHGISSFTELCLQADRTRVSHRPIDAEVGSGKRTRKGGRFGNNSLRR